MYLSLIPNISICATLKCKILYIILYYIMYMDYMYVYYIMYSILCIIYIYSCTGWFNGKSSALERFKWLPAFSGSKRINYIFRAVKFLIYLLHTAML